MSAWKCNACLSVYSDTCPDGQAYFHVCAWIPDPAAPVPTVPTIDLRPLIKRPGHRDETFDFLVIGGDDDSPPVRVVLIRSEGAGRTPAVIAAG